jgi:hypothetical protein
MKEVDEKLKKTKETVMGSQFKELDFSFFCRFCKIPAMSRTFGAPVAGLCNFC